MKTKKQNDIPRRPRRHRLRHRDSLQGPELEVPGVGTQMQRNACECALLRHKKCDQNESATVVEKT
jgi:hypothetical protein